jgi:DNA-binding winged helix-turn-helix (wHTH) protein/Tol biopolymer transport system component
VATSPESDHAQRPALIRFGEFQLDLQTGELSRNGTRNRLQGQPLQLLELLLQHPGQLVTRDRIQQYLWPDGIVVEFEHSVNAAVKRLREALGDNAENPSFIETIPRRGYRFIASVSDVRLHAAPASVAPIKGDGMVSPISQPRPGSGWLRTVVKAAVLLIVVTVGLLIALWWRRPIEIRQRRLTANTAHQPVLGGEISSDGRYLAFADKTGFYLRQIDNGETHALSLPQGFNAVPIAWYPDGTHMVATWIEGPKSPSSLWQISIMGGAPRKLIDNGRQASVSRDGSQIAFVRGPNVEEELWTMGGNGENPRRLLLAPRRCMFGAPAWSPDERRLAYVITSYEPAQWGTKTNLATLDLSNGREKVILSPPTTNSDLNDSVQLGLGLAWTSDNYLVYSISEAPPNNGDSNLWRVALDSSGRVVGHPLRLTTTPDEVSDLSASGDGKRIAYTKYTLNPSVYISELGSGGTGLSTPQRLTIDDWKNIPFAWTPDSKAVIFVSDRDGIFHIFKQQIDKTVPELLVGGKEQANVPRLAPDNSTLLYVIWPKPGEPAAPARLMRIPLAGGQPQTVLQRQGLGNLQCARPPSTVCLYHVGSATQLSFFRFDPATGASEELPQLRIDDQAPHAYGWNLSPDGKRLVIARNEGLQKDPSFILYSLEVGSKRKVIANGWAGLAGFDFAADGKSLWAAAYTNDGKSALLNIDLKGQTRTVFEDTEMSIGWAIPSPDGKHLALGRARGAGNVWMLEFH